MTISFFLEGLTGLPHNSGMATNHESYESDHKIKTASDFSFGMTMSGAFLLISVWAFFNRTWAPYSLIVASLFGICAITKPKLLSPFNRVWTRFGLAISYVTQPILMFVLFYFFLTPFSFLFRLFANKDLHIKFDPNAVTYWIHKKTYAGPKKSMKNQF